MSHLCLCLLSIKITHRASDCSSSFAYSSFNLISAASGIRPSNLIYSRFILSFSTSKEAPLARLINLRHKNLSLVLFSSVSRSWNSRANSVSDSPEEKLINSSSSECFLNIFWPLKHCLQDKYRTTYLKKSFMSDHKLPVELTKTTGIG